jgi:hypothetical protein
MTDLLDFALDAHGGRDNWKGVTGVDLRLTLGGYLFEIKQHPDGLRTVLVKVDARRPRTVIVPFPEQGRRGIYQEGKVWVQTDVGGDGRGAAGAAHRLRRARTNHTLERSPVFLFHRVRLLELLHDALPARVGWCDL